MRTSKDFWKPLQGRHQVKEASRTTTRCGCVEDSALNSSPLKMSVTSPGTHCTSRISVSDLGFGP